MLVRWQGLFPSAVLAVLLAGCSLAPVVSQQSVDYNSTVEDVTSNVLVQNILRARDGAPLFFSDISQIRGSVSANLSAQTNFPFGPSNRPPTGTGVRDTAQGSLSIVTNPTFDIAPTNTKQFYQGILQPLSKNVLAYYIQRGIRADWLFNLMISHVDLIQVSGKGQSVIESTDWFDTANQYSAAPNFTTLVNEWYSNKQKPRIIVSSKATKFGPPVLPNARALVEAKTADLDAEATKDGLIQFKKKSSTTSICVSGPKGIGYISLEVVANSVTKPLGPDDIPKSDSCVERAPSATAQDDSPAKSFMYYRARTRSVEAIFYYLGALVRSNAPPPIPFHIRSGPTSKARFTVDYRSNLYSVDEIGSDDETVTILSILNDLLNLNRDANEVPTTKAVQAVGANT